MEFFLISCLTSRIQGFFLSIISFRDAQESFSLASGLTPLHCCIFNLGLQTCSFSFFHLKSTAAKYWIPQNAFNDVFRNKCGPIDSRVCFLKWLSIKTGTNTCIRFLRSVTSTSPSYLNRMSRDCHSFNNRKGFALDYTSKLLRSTKCPKTLKSKWYLGICVTLIIQCDSESSVKMQT
jgi:hypothetical protein